MQPFFYHRPTEVFGGEGAFSRAAEAHLLKKRVWLVIDKAAAEKSGALLEVCSWLESKGLTYGIWDSLSPNPEDQSLFESADSMQKGGYNFALGIGGGSALDAVKFIATAAKDSVAARHALKESSAPISQSIRESFPIGVIPTLSGAGSEMTWASVVSLPKIGEKKVVRSPLLFPAFAVLDSRYTRSAPKEEVFAALVDCMVHYFEQYLTFRTKETPLQDSLALARLETLWHDLIAIRDNFEDAYQNDSARRERLAISAATALHGWHGMGVPHDFSTHLISYHFTPRYRISHGAALAVLYPATLEARLSKKEARLSQLGRRLGAWQGAREGIHVLRELFGSLGFPRFFCEYGLDDSAIETAISWFESRGVAHFGEEGFTLDTLKILLKFALKKEG